MIPIISGDDDDADAERDGLLEGDEEQLHRAGMLADDRQRARRRAVTSGLVTT